MPARLCRYGACAGSPMLWDQLKASPVTQSKGTEAKMPKGAAVDGEINRRGDAAAKRSSKSPLGFAIHIFPTRRTTKVLPMLPLPPVALRVGRVHEK